MTLLRTLRPTLVLALAATALSQTHAPQIQSGPAPGFLAYQALFNQVVWLESRATQADAASSNWIRSEIPKAAGLTNVEYAALVKVAQDYSQAKAAYISARDAVMKDVYAQQAAGGKATWAQTVQLSSLFQQYIATVNGHIAQLPVALGAAGAQALDNYVNTTVAAKTVWAH